MARAKRTDRAEARRQYRAYLAAQAEAEAAAAAAAAAEAEAADEPDEEAPAPLARGLFGRRPALAASTAVGATPRVATRRATAPATAATPARTGPVPFIRALGMAYRQINYREDLRYLPRLVTRTHAVWPGALLAIVSAIVVIQEHDPKSVLVGLALLSLPPMPLVPAMLTGLLAPRAAWLAGGIVGFISGLCIWIAIPLVSSDLLDQKSTDIAGVAVYWMGSAVCFGVLFGALSAWYRRFLQLIMPPKPAQSSRSNRSRRPTSRPGVKATAKPAAKPAATVKVAPKPGPAKR